MRKDPDLIEIEPLTEGFEPRQLLGLFQERDGITYTTQLTDHEVYEILQEMIQFLHRKING